MTATGKKRLSGLYFVVDPTEHPERLSDVLEAALRGGVDLVQVWWGRGAGGGKESPTSRLVANVSSARDLTERHGVPLIVNNDLIMAEKVGAEGVHMDDYSLTPVQIRRRLGDAASIVGYTTGNDLERVRWAAEKGADYVSFCSIYQSPSAASCDIVPLEIVKKAKRMSDTPIFASGGINLRNAKEVIEAGADGIAVFSAIQRASAPEEAARKFKEIIDSVRAARSGGAPALDANVPA